MIAALSPVQLIAVVLAISAATFVTRSGLLLLGERLALSPAVEAALRFAPVCALAALILPEIVYPAGALDVSLDNPRLPAAVAATAFLLRRQSIVGCIAVGMAVYVLFRFW